MPSDYSIKGYTWRRADGAATADVWVSACAVPGCLLGCLGAGWIVDRLGAKFGLWVCAFAFAASSVGTRWFAGTLSEFSARWHAGRLGASARPRSSPPCTSRKSLPPASVGDWSPSTNSESSWESCSAQSSSTCSSSASGGVAWNVADGCAGCSLRGLCRPCCSGRCPRPDHDIPILESQVPSI